MENEYKIIKQEHLYTSEDKLKFCGEGEWVNEPDEVHLEYLGYDAKIIRVFRKETLAPILDYFGGYLCGYVKIQKPHPYFGKDYDDMEINAHGGLTFADVGEEHWIGFDCAHLGDCTPTMERMRRTMPELKSIREEFPLPEGFENFALFNPVYRNIQYCIEICLEMIDQLVEREDKK